MEKILHQDKLTPLPAGRSEGNKAKPEHSRMPAWLRSMWTMDRFSLACLILGLLSLALLLPGWDIGIWLALGCSIGGIITGILAARQDGWNLSNRFGLILSAVSICVLIVAAVLAGSVISQIEAHMQAGR